MEGCARDALMFEIIGKLLISAVEQRLRVDLLIEIFREAQIADAQLVQLHRREAARGRGGERPRRDLRSDQDRDCGDDGQDASGSGFHCESCLAMRARASMY